MQNNFDIEQDRVYSILTAQKKVLDDILEEVAYEKNKKFGTKGVKIKEILRSFRVSTDFVDVEELDHFDITA